MRRVLPALFSLLLAGLVLTPIGGPEVAPATDGTGGLVTIQTPGGNGCCRQ